VRLGVLDVGSNTVNLLVVDAHPGASPDPLVSHKYVLRLIQYLTPAGTISEAGVEALVEIIGDLAAKAARENVDEMLPFATSALREATNGAEVIRLIAERTGVILQVLSGSDEGRLTFLAVRRWFGWSAGTVLLLDIGGGSLEIASGGDEYPDVSVSVPLGAGRTTMDFLQSDPPTEAQLNLLRDHSDNVLSSAVPAFAHVGAPQRIVGSSKTIRSLARLAGSSTQTPGIGERVVLKRSSLKDWIPRLARLNADSRQALPGITPDRTFQIVGGAIVLHRAMKAFEIDELEVSPWALREGIILRYLDSLDTEELAVR
jgi:exopolyphosphatase/guanosine-5'-triphosphate,3'-diphosphate pyrophosphatase